MFIRAIQTLLDFVFPRSAFDKKLENISFSEFIDNSGDVRIMEYNNVTYFLDFKNSFVRNSIHSLKYRGNKKIARWYGQIIYEYLLEELNENSQKEKTILIPTPISKHKLHKRGWNQVGLITEYIKEFDTLECFEYDLKNFIKIKDTESQTKMRSKKERQNNILDSFSVKNPEMFYKRKIIVIDDVVTTGSTLNEISDVLKRAGAKNVRKIAIAH